MPEPTKNTPEPQGKDNRFSSFFSRIGAREIAFMLVSFMFAIVIWVYVLNVENPTREKIVRDVRISFSGEDRLKNNQRLTVKGDRNAILSEEATVIINVPANLYSEITADSITAELDLSGISTPGEHTVKIVPRIQGSNDISVVSVSPREVTVEIDLIRERVLPVEVHYFGELPQDHWRSGASLTPAFITLDGAASELGLINNAVVEIDLTDVTKPVYESANILLYDRDGNTIDPSMFGGDLPYTTIEMDVRPTKTVPIDVMGSLVGIDEILSGFGLTGVTVSPRSTVTLAAAQELLDGIDSILIEPVNLAGKSGSETLLDVSLQLPEGVRKVSTESYNVSIRIEEDFDALNFYDLPIQIRNLAPGMKAELFHADEPIADGKVTINGPLSAISQIKKNQVALYVDASGLGPGAHAMNVYCETGEALSSITILPWPGSVMLTLTSTN